MSQRSAHVIVPITVADRVHEVIISATKENGKWIGKNPDPIAYQAHAIAEQEVFTAQDILICKQGELKKVRGNQARQARQAICQEIRKARAAVTRAQTELYAVYTKYPKEVEFI